MYIKFYKYMSRMYIDIHIYIYIRTPTSVNDTHFPLCLFICGFMFACLIACLLACLFVCLAFQKTIHLSDCHITGLLPEVHKWLYWDLIVKQ